MPCQGMSRKKVKKTEKITINLDWPAMPGSISQTSGKCGKKNCRCQRESDYVHGPYYRWTGKINGRYTSVILTKEEAEECRRRVKRWRGLEKKIALLAKKGLSRAPWKSEKTA